MSPIFLLAVMSLDVVSSAAFVHRVPTAQRRRQRSPFSSSSLLLLSARKDDPTWFEEREGEEGTENEDDGVRYLGKGENALVRPGAVLIAPDHEHNHFLKKAAVFVYAVGLDVFGERAVRGVVLDHPTVFTMGEMAPGTVQGLLAGNLLFQGGDQGNDKVLMMHDDAGFGREIGNSGVYEGGLVAATRLVDDGDSEPDRFKFFFNHVEFSDRVLRSMLAQTDSDGDAWISAEIPVDLVLDSDLDKGEAWRGLRRKLKAVMEEDTDNDNDNTRSRAYIGPATPENGEPKSA